MYSLLKIRFKLITFSCYIPATKQQLLKCKMLKNKNQIISHVVEARRWDVAAAFWLSRSTC